MRAMVRNYVILFLMCLSAFSATVLQPSQLTADDLPPLILEDVVPKHFGSWSMDESQAPVVVNPQLQESLDKIYTQVLTRNYIHKDGYRVMLSLPYGRDQSDAFKAHDPQGCYPAQGFQILSNVRDTLQTRHGKIPVTRMVARYKQRNEPITYWFTVGEYAVNNKWDKKKAQIQYVFKDQVPDGVLFRVSSIDPNNQNAFQYQVEFIEELLSVIPEQYRVRLSGLK